MDIPIRNMESSVQIPEKWLFHRNLQKIWNNSDAIPAFQPCTIALRILSTMIRKGTAKSKERD